MKCSAGNRPSKNLSGNFPKDLIAARLAYPDARIEEHKDGFLFRASLPPVPKTKLLVK